MWSPQDSIPSKKQKKSKYPAVFLINDQTSRIFEKLNVKYRHDLISACDDDMMKAYKRWMQLLHDIEKYAEQNQYPIKGVKMWIKLFWAPDGTIDHLAYQLKPNSRNVDTAALTHLLENFIHNSKIAVETDAPFSHYATASFPTHYRKSPIE